MKNFPSLLAENFYNFSFYSWYHSAEGRKALTENNQITLVKRQTDLIFCLLFFISRSKVRSG